MDFCNLIFAKFEHQIGHLVAAQEEAVYKKLDNYLSNIERDLQVAIEVLEDKEKQHDTLVCKLREEQSSLKKVTLQLHDLHKQKQLILKEQYDTLVSCMNSALPGLYGYIFWLRMQENNKFSKWDDQRMQVCVRTRR